MTIQSGDVKLLKSAVMADVPEGGGAPTGLAIADGVSNALFPDLSELDRAGGRVNLRKTFVSVQTDDTDTYFGANVIVAEPPQDPRVSVTLFSTERTFDTREQAQVRIEAYLNKGPEWPGYLFENHIAGQRVIQLFQRVSDSLPTVGQTLVLIQDEGLPTQKEQYVRATAVSAVVRTFTYNTDQDYAAQVVTLALSDALRQDFTGSPASRTFTRASNATRVRDTVVADAGTYVGVVPLVAPASVGDFSLQGASIYTQLVPSAQTETPVLDGRLSSVVSRISAGAHTVEIPEIGHSAADAVTATTRGYNFVRTLRPLPAPGTLTVSYRAQGRWYSLTDDGAGALRGRDSAYGVGTLNYDSGGALVTLGALPDVGSALVWQWGSGVHYAVRTSASAPKAVVSGSLGESVEPGSLAVTWLQGGVEKTATTSAGGALSGNGCTGYIVQSTGAYYLTWTTPPDPNSQLGLTYTQGTGVSASSGSLSPTYPAPGFIAFTLPNRPIKPGSVTLVRTIAESVQSTGSHQAPDGVCYWPCDPADQGSPCEAGWCYRQTGWIEVVDAQWNTTYRQLACSDDGAGHIGANGTLNYATGQVLFEYAPEVTASVWDGSRWDTRTSRGTLVGDIAIDWQVDESPVPATRSLSVALPPPVITFGGNLLSDTLVPGSLRFQWNGQEYRDSGDGTLYRHALPWTTQAGLLAGTVDYQTRQATLTDYVSGSGTITVTSCLTRYGSWTTTQCHARTPGSPLRPGSFSIRATTIEGALLEGIADVNGVIDAEDIQGRVEQAMGVVEVRFGQRVLDSALTAAQKAESWYDAADVDADGTIWRPRPILPETVRIHCVVLSHLPLDADLLGIDPVRLPTDGRVPIFRPGGFAVVGHTGKITAGVSNGQVLDCARVRLSRVRVLGQDGVVIHTGYSADLEAGRVTFTDVTGYPQPVTIEHRVEDMAVVRDVQINGELSFTRALTHDYPLTDPPTSFVSSALVAGDLFARVSLVFDQVTWNGAWADAPSGSAATATFNHTQYPIRVSNRGAVTERWVVRFTNSTAFEVIGENVGVIATGNTSADCAPHNPATGVPYFALPALGWGSGWATGNVLRFNSIGSQFPVWVVRTVQQGPESVPDDRFTVLIRGDVDTP